MYIDTRRSPLYGTTLNLSKRATETVHSLPASCTVQNGGRIRVWAAWTRGDFMLLGV